MDPLTIAAVLMAGLFTGNLLFSAVLHWVAASAELLRSSPGKWSLVAAASLFNSGPWLLVIVGTFAYYVHSESWAMWFFAGAGIAVSFFLAITVVFGLKQRAIQARRKNAA